MLVLSGYVCSKSIEEKKYDSGRSGNVIKVKLSDNGITYWATAYVPADQTFVMSVDGLHQLEVGSYVNLFVDVNAYVDRNGDSKFMFVIR